VNRLTSIEQSAIPFAAALGCAVILGVSPLSAQDAGERPNAPVELVDRVAAVVGDTVVLYTEILETLLQEQAQGATLPAPGTPAYDSLVTTTLSTLVDQLVLLQRAKEEEISVPEDVVESETDLRFQEVRGSFRNAAEFERAIQESGRTLVQYRLYLRSQVRAQRMINQFVQQIRGSLPAVTVSDDEVREWFEQNTQGQTQPPRISFEQVVIRPTPEPEAEAAARQRTVEALQAVRDGMDFAVAARRYSEDAGNRDQGGDLGWVRRASIDPDFAAAAWAARTGTPIGPVRSQFGYHVIKVENVRGGERKISHILIRAETDEDDVQQARELAEAVADSARDGVAIERLARSHGMSEEPVRLPNVPLDRLREGGYGEYVQHLSTPIPGEVIGPFPVTVRGQRFVVLKVVDFTPGGSLRLEDVQEEIREGLVQQKGLERLVEELRNEIYVDVRL
jgi:parvulin-like peptidyl-prolyl isomerase